MACPDGAARCSSAGYLQIIQSGLNRGSLKPAYTTSANLNVKVLDFVQLGGLCRLSCRDRFGWERSCRSELRAFSSCPIRWAISPRWAIPPPTWPTLEAPSAASSSDVPGGRAYAIISESIEPSGTSTPSLKYALIARSVCSPVNLQCRTRSSRCAARRFRVSRRRSRKPVGQAIDNASRCGVTSCWQRLLTSCSRRSTKSRWDRASLAAVNSRCSSTWCSPKSRGVERVGTFA